VPWHEFEQEREVAFQPMVVATFFTPSLWVAELTVVLLYPVPWQVEHDLDACFECLPVDGGIAWHDPHEVVGGGT
jgi:hypothetical protein